MINISIKKTVIKKCDCKSQVKYKPITRKPPERMPVKWRTVGII